MNRAIIQRILNIRKICQIMPKDTNPIPKKLTTTEKRKKSSISWPTSQKTLMKPENYSMITKNELKRALKWRTLATHYYNKPTNIAQ